MDHKGLASVYLDNNCADTFAVFYILRRMDVWDLLNPIHLLHWSCLWECLGPAISDKGMQAPGTQ